MLDDRLLRELSQLSRVEKVRAIQVLADYLAEDEDVMSPEKKELIDGLRVRHWPRYGI